ncbi:hypothetical protein PHMEG_00022769 [Phytophthora megakarya]|uniref:No apical meristem-associated C-terminal domain-containing protein n=1 Tax=Phytophthora megakarya TaxID=4795 RepID=A0A225VKY3_9STRA|nr:hypothetical protein PHMEG_00022769 [Phytophthora megakarya]
MTDNAGRGTNYSDAENKALCEAWLSVSGDAATGTNQNGDVFYNKVKIAFEEILGSTSDRPIGSLRSRFSVISRSTSKFVGCYNKINDIPVSGRAPSDVFDQAVELYESEHGKFRYKNCWKVLRDSQKWGAWRQGSKKKCRGAQRVDDAAQNQDQPVDAVASFAADTGDTEGDDAERRPMGQKRAKMERTNLALYARQVQAAERMAKTSEARVRVAQDQVEQNLFSMIPSQGDAESMEFVSLKRQIILARLRKEVAVVAGRESAGTTITGSGNTSAAGMSTVATAATTAAATATSIVTASIAETDITDSLVI